MASRPRCASSSCLCLAVLSLIGASGIAGAATLQGSFTGMISGVDNSGGDFPYRGYPDLGPYMAEGQAIYGTLRIDTDLMRSLAADVEPGADHGDWSAPGAWLWIDVTIATTMGPRSLGGSQRAEEEGRLQLFNDVVYPTDYGDDSADDWIVSRRSADVAPSPGESGVFESFEIWLNLYEISLLPTVAALLEGDDPDQSIDWTRGFDDVVSFGGGGNFTITRTSLDCITDPVICYGDIRETRGSIQLESLNLAVIPLPGTISMIVPALGVLGWMRTRLKRRYHPGGHDPATRS